MNLNKRNAAPRKIALMRRILAGETHTTLAAERGVSTVAIWNAERSLARALIEGRFYDPEDPPSDWASLRVRRIESTKWLRMLEAYEDELRRPNVQGNAEPMARTGA